jgi:hypothetical protein
LLSIRAARLSSPKSQAEGLRVDSEQHHSTKLMALVYRKGFFTSS